MKNIVLNTTWFLKPAILVLIWVVWNIIPNHGGIDAKTLVIGSLILLVFFSLQPISYTFDRQYLSINYIFGYRRKFEWCRITKIEKGNTYRDCSHYFITMYKLKKEMYAYTASIIANKSTRFYIKKFWDGDFRE